MFWQIICCFEVLGKIRTTTYWNWYIKRFLFDYINFNGISFSCHTFLSNLFPWKLSVHNEGKSFSSIQWVRSHQKIRFYNHRTLAMTIANITNHQNICYHLTSVVLFFLWSFFIFSSKSSLKSCSTAERSQIRKNIVYTGICYLLIDIAQDVL